MARTLTHDPSRRRLLAGGLLLALGTLAVFSGALGNGFVDYDDGEYVTDNPHLKNGLTWSALRWAFTPGGSSCWHPLTWCSHLLDWQLFGGTPAGHHLTSLLWHAGSTALALVVLWRLSGKMAGSLFATAWWAWHPLRVESVAWASERKDVMSVFFGLLAIWCYIVSSRREQERLTGARGWYWLSVLSAAAGLLSKSMLVTMPAMLCLLDLWPLRRWSGKATGTLTQPAAGDGAPPTAGSGRSLSTLIMEKWPWGLLAIITAGLTYFSQQQAGAISNDWPFPDRLANAFIAIPAYLGDMIWPRNLAVFYPHPGSVPVVATLVSAGIVTAITTFAWRLRATRPWWLLGWAWFLVSWFPASGSIVQAGVQARADRYTYLPSLGLALILAMECDRWLIAPRTRRLVLAAAAGLLTLLVVLTQAQVRTWKDPVTLFSHAAQATPGNYYANYVLGRIFARQGETDRARACYEASLRISPDYATAHLYLGILLSQTGNPEAAIGHYKAVLARNPADSNTHLAMGEALTRLQQTEEAIASYRKAVESEPRIREANFQLARLYAATNRQDEAIRAYEAELAIQPDYVDVHNNLANLLAQSGRTTEALQHYEVAIRIRPEFAQAWANSGVILWQLGRKAEGLSHLRRALLNDPNLPGLGPLLENAERELRRGVLQNRSFE